MKTVARLTGLSADVIRAWERRYGVVSPVRGPRGARLYTEDDVRRLRLLGRATAAGRAIGDIVRLDQASLEALASELEPTPTAQGYEALSRRVLDALSRGAADAVDRELAEALVALGGRRFVRELAAPLLTEIGDRWSRGQLSVADEHLLSAALRSLLSSLIRWRERTARPTVLLATPSGERHELGLMLVGLLCVDLGLGLHYLGADLPAAEIVGAARKAGVSVIGLGLVGEANRDRAISEVRVVERTSPRDVELWLGGRNAAAIAQALQPTRAQVLDELALVESELTRVRHGIRTPH